MPGGQGCGSAPRQTAAPECWWSLAGDPCGIAETLREVWLPVCGGRRRGSEGAGGMSSPSPSPVLPNDRFSRLLLGGGSLPSQRTAKTHGGRWQVVGEVDKNISRKTGWAWYIFAHSVST